MDQSIYWLYEHEDTYRRRTGRQVWSLSDWHNDPGDVLLPARMLGELNIDKSAASRYRFLDSINETKNNIALFYRNTYSINLEKADIALCHNGTSAIYLLVQSLASHGVRRVLVVTPAYFSLFSALDLARLTPIYAHCNLLDSLSMDAHRIVAVARDQMADAIFLTNPIFSTGKPLTEVLVRDLASFAEKNGIWLILDEMLGGLPWQDTLGRPFVSALARNVANNPRCVYIWSLSKSLFLNGLKHALVHAPSTIIEKMERVADVMIGGLYAQQITLVEAIYSSPHVDEIQQCARENVRRFAATYDLCATCLEGTSLQLTNTESGFHTFAFHSSGSHSQATSAKRIAQEMISQHGMSVIPATHFGFPPFGPIAFRINISKSAGRLFEGLVRLAKIVDENSYFSDEG